MVVVCVLAFRRTLLLWLLRHRGVQLLRLHPMAAHGVQNAAAAKALVQENERCEVHGTPALQAHSRKYLQSFLT